MKNEILKLISELEARKKSHRSDFIIAETPLKGEVAIALEDECDFFIDKLKLLLKDESKQPQPPISQTPMLGEVPQVVNDRTEETSKAVDGATPVVRQNEQTKKVKKAIPFGIAMLRAKQYYRNTEDDNIPF